MFITVLLVGVPAAACVALYMLASETTDTVEGAQTVPSTLYPASTVERRPMIINSARSTSRL